MLYTDVDGQCDKLVTEFPSNTVREYAEGILCAKNELDLFSCILTVQACDGNGVV